MLGWRQSAVMAGLKVVPIKSLADGSLDLEDLRAKAEKHKDNLAAFMVSHCRPSTLLDQFTHFVHLPRSHTPRRSAYSKTASSKPPLSSTQTAGKYTSTVPTSTRKSDSQTPRSAAATCAT